MRRAQQLDPLSVRINADLGMAISRRAGTRKPWHRKGRALELAPDSAVPRWIRGMAHEQLGTVRGAELDMKAAFGTWSGDESTKGALGHLYAVSGKQATEAREVLERADERRTTRPTLRFSRPSICAGLNDTDAALTWLEQAVDERSGSVRYLKIDPRLANLRNEPRYARLMERVGLPP